MDENVGGLPEGLKDSKFSKTELMTCDTFFLSSHEASQVDSYASRGHSRSADCMQAM